MGLDSPHTIEIDDFVRAEDIDQRYLDWPYYLVPNGKTGADAFVVIRAAMKRKSIPKILPRGMEPNLVPLPQNGFELAISIGRFEQRMIVWDN